MRKQPTVESVVFVIDDDASVRASLKSLFKSVGLYVELFGSADEFLKSQRPDAPSCLVLDVSAAGHQRARDTGRTRPPGHVMFSAERQHLSNF
jgi:FixJ family two-component response regulator